jgi:hypothetical protein
LWGLNYENVLFGKHLHILHIAQTKFILKNFSKKKILLFKKKIYLPLYQPVVSWTGLCKFPFNSQINLSEETLCFPA